MNSTEEENLSKDQNNEDTNGANINGGNIDSENINIPIVTTLHGTDITLVGKHPFYKPAVRFSIDNSDFVTSVSEDLKKETIKLFGVMKNINVIPNFT